MPSKTDNCLQMADDLRPHQDELLYLTELAGMYMDKEIFRSLIQLLNMGVSPDAVFNLLKIIRRKKGKHIKSRSSVL